MADDYNQIPSDWRILKSSEPPPSEGVHRLQQSGVCGLWTSASSFPGQACEGCGHTNLVHPGNHNPSLTKCAICLVLATVPRA